MMSSASSPISRHIKPAMVRHFFQRKIEGTIQSIPFKYYGYYWSGKSGTVQFLTYTAQNLFDEALPDFSELLNGFVVTKD